MGWILSLVIFAGVVVAVFLLLGRARRAQREVGVRHRGSGGLGVGSFSYEDAKDDEPK